MSWHHAHIISFTLSAGSWHTQGRNNIPPFHQSVRTDYHLHIQILLYACLQHLQYSTVMLNISFPFAFAQTLHYAEINDDVLQNNTIGKGTAKTNGWNLQIDFLEMYVWIIANLATSNNSEVASGHPWKFSFTARRMVVKSMVGAYTHIYIYTYIHTYSYICIYTLIYCTL